MNHTESRKRVVVTGLGAVTPIGHSTGETWRNALEGRSGIDTIQRFDPAECPVKIAGEVTDFDPTKEVEPIQPYPDREPLKQLFTTKDLRKYGKFIQYGVHAGVEAYRDSNLDSARDQLDPTRIGINVGAGMGGLPEIERIHNDLLTKGYKRVTPFLIPAIIPNMVSGLLGIQLHCKGPNVCNVTACSSSAHSVGEAYHMILRGDVDVMIAGGAESVISPLGIGGFAAMKALSSRNEEPTKASRPFDTGRDGFVMGEGAGVLILEEYEFAKRRGAQIYAELAGYGLSSDAHHITLPAPEGEGGYRSMEMALQRAGVKPEQVGYINAHGTSTPAGDAEEARAIAKLFPNAKDHLNVSSTKSMIGHLLGASGAVESVFSILCVKEGKIPPTINLENLDPDCQALGLDFTPNQAVEKNVDYALSNSFGFGGTNASLLFGKA